MGSPPLATRAADRESFVDGRPISFPAATRKAIVPDLFPGSSSFFVRIMHLENRDKEDTKSATGRHETDAEIEVTPEMIKAGLVEFFHYDPEGCDAEETVMLIYNATTLAKKDFS
jgi:hypothetical protein